MRQMRQDCPMCGKKYVIAVEDNTMTSAESINAYGWEKLREAVHNCTHKEDKVDE